MSAFMEALPNLALLLGVLVLVLVTLLVGDYLGHRRRQASARTMRCRVMVQRRTRPGVQVTCHTHEVSWNARQRGWLCPNRSTLVVGRRVQP